MNIDEHAELILSRIPVGAVLHANDGRILSINAAAKRILGVDVHDIEGITPLDPYWKLVNEDYSPVQQLDIPSEATRLTGKPVSNKLIGVYRSSEDFVWVTVDTILVEDLEDAGGPMVIATFTEVTAQITSKRKLEETRKQLEQLTIRETNERIRLSRILDSLKVAVLVVNDEGRIVFVNDNSMDLLGADEGKLIGRSVEDFVPIIHVRNHQDLVKSFFDNSDLVRRMSTKRYVYLQNAEGDLIPVEIVLAMLEDQLDHHCAVILRNLSGQIQIESELESSLFRLEDSLRKEQYALQVQKRFIAAMSHELRTPLNAIIGYSELINHLGLENIKPETLSRYVEDIHGSGIGLLELVNGILDYGRLEYQELYADHEPISLGALIGEVSKSLELTRLEKNIGLRISISDDIQFMGNFNAWRQILTNIINNSLKYCPQDSTVMIASRRRNGRLLLFVGDNGPGLPRYVIENVGKPFIYAGDPERTGPQPGYGLGLSIVADLLAKQSSEMRIRSLPHRGTVFRMELPAIPPEAKK